MSTSNRLSENQVDDIEKDYDSDETILSEQSDELDFNTENTAQVWKLTLCQSFFTVLF